MISKEEKVSLTACVRTARVAEDLRHGVKIRVTSEVPGDSLLSGHSQSTPNVHRQSLLQWADKFSVAITPVFY